MPGGGGSKTQTMTQTNDPWSGQQPYLSQGFQAAQQYVLNSPQQFFPNSTVVPFSNQTEQSLGMIEQRALNGSPVQTNMNQSLAATLGGDYLAAGNPHFEQMAGRVRSEVLPSINAGFNAAGRTGSGLAARAASLGLGDAIGALAHKDYGDERQRMLQAASLAPQAAALDYQDATMLGQVGGVREDLAGRQLQDQINRFNYQQQEPAQRVANYMALVGGGQYGGTTTATSPLYSNRTAGMLGGALGLAGLGSSLFGAPGGGGLLRGLF